ncbi:MAG: hypothetical protein PUB75_05275 [Firmicutes bacterium]|nr:hypothetical protein [Bacillota bacterium]
MAFVKFVFVLLILVPVAFAMKAILGKVIGEYNSIIKKTREDKNRRK